MRGVVKILVILLLILMVGGFAVSVVINVRNAAQRMNCQNNLRMVIGLALQNYHDVTGHFPAGTVPNPTLPPDKRLSWLTQIKPYMESAPKALLDYTESWDADVNCPPRWLVGTKENTGPSRVELIGDIMYFFCPANPARNDPSLPCPTHYVGLAGLGAEAAELPLADPRAGFFGYDRRLSIQDIKDGLATTMAVTEVIDGGPWTAGGRATVRGLISGDSPYLGQGGQFASLHRESNLFLISRPVITNVLFADGSVRQFTASVSPQVFEALATVAGGEQVGELP